MSAEDVDLGVSPGKWNGHVRRARIGRERKHVALTVSSYADKHGRDVKCGVARLAADCEIGYSTARRYLAWLRDVGLIELVRPGNHKKGLADEYRLIIDEAKQVDLDIPTVDEYRTIVDSVNGSNKTAQKDRRMRVQRSPKESANATEEPNSSALTMVSANDGYQRSFSAPLALTQGEPPPSRDHLVSEVRPSTGGAPPPDPRRRPPPPASATDEQKSPYEPLTPAQDQQRNSLPRTRAPSAAEHVAPVVDFFTREAM